MYLTVLAYQKSLFRTKKKLRRSLSPLHCISIQTSKDTWKEKKVFKFSAGARERARRRLGSDWSAAKDFSTRRLFYSLSPPGLCALAQPFSTGTMHSLSYAARVCVSKRGLSLSFFFHRAVAAFFVYCEFFACALRDLEWGVAHAGGQVLKIGWPTPFWYPTGDD